MRALTAVLVAAVLAGPPAVAASLETVLPGSDVHRNARDGDTLRFDLWHLAPDGGLTGNYRTEREIHNGRLRVLEGPVRGHWTAQGDTFCVEGKGFEAPGRLCFRLRKGGFGADEYVAVNVDTGFVWQMFIYRR